MIYPNSIILIPKNNTSKYYNNRYTVEQKTNTLFESKNSIKNVGLILGLSLFLKNRKNIASILQITKKENTLEKITKALGPSFRKMNRKGAYDPQEIDNVMKKTCKSYKELEFFKIKGGPNGRVITYSFKNGDAYNLEAREDGKKQYVVRLFKVADKNKTIYKKYKRLYINHKGIFTEKSYNNSNTHLIGTSNTKNWIENSPNKQKISNENTPKQVNKTKLAIKYKNIASLEREIPIQNVLETQPEIWLEGDKPNIDKLNALFSHYARYPKNIKERIYPTTEDIVVGKKIQYKIPDDGIYILNTFQNKTGNYRLSLYKCIDKKGNSIPADKRLYLQPSGEFLTGKTKLDGCIEIDSNLFDL